MKESFLEILTTEQKKDILLRYRYSHLEDSFRDPKERNEVVIELIKKLDITNPEDINIITCSYFLRYDIGYEYYLYEEGGFCEYIPEKKCLAFGKINKTLFDEVTKCVFRQYPETQNFIPYSMSTLDEARYKKLLELRIKQFEEKNPTEEPNSNIHVGFIHNILEKNKYDYKIQRFKVIDFNESIIEIFEAKNSKVYNHKIKLPENIFFQLYYNQNFSYEVIVDCTTGIVKINHMDDDDNFTKKYPNGELINKNETLILQEKVRESFLQKTTSTQTTEEDKILENIYSINKNGKLSISTFTQTEPDIEQPQIIGDILE